MKDDNTPTVSARRRKPTSHVRLRLETARKLHDVGRRAKGDIAKERKEAEKNGERVADAEIATTLETLSNINSLKKPPKAKSKFRKRQLHKSWLPTHLFHAKRAVMTEPKEPLWRFAIPLTPTEKTYRITHRAGTLRGCMAWDMSYMSTVGLEGAEASLIGLLRAIGVKEEMLSGRKGLKWRDGTRFWEGWVRERDNEERWISQIKTVWSAEKGDIEGQNEIAMGKVKHVKRGMFVRVPPSAFLQLWNELLKVAKIQKPAVMVQDLRFEIGSLELTGPGSTEALIAALRPVTRAKDDDTTNSSLATIWTSIASVTNPSALPCNAILAFEVSDPRLQHPPRTVKAPLSADDEKLFDLLSTWPPDTSKPLISLFSRDTRLLAQRSLPSQGSINRRKGVALPGSDPEPLSADPRIPILLLASRPETLTSDETSNNVGRGRQGTWTLLLPWKCLPPVWSSLMYYPLSSGGNPRFGGLNEKRQNCYETGIPWFPADYPGTQAGFDWELREREKRKIEWSKKPKGRRIEFASLDLGESNKKGEVGTGWACDWEFLFGGKDLGAASEDANKTATEISNEAHIDGEQVVNTGDSLPFTNSACVPQMHFRYEPTPLKLGTPLPAKTDALSPICSTLSTVKITLLHRGTPTSCARIYRFPSAEPDHLLRAAWMKVATVSRKTKDFRQSIHPHKNGPSGESYLSSNDNAKNGIGEIPVHHERRALAASLISAAQPFDAETATPTANDPTYPSVPGLEDLIGYITTGNFNLGEGRGTGIGSIVLGKIVNWEKEKGASVPKGGFCIVRNAGEAIGRVARWEFV